MAINLELVIGAKNLAGQAFSSLQAQLSRTGGAVGSFKSKLGEIKSAVADFQQAQKGVASEGVSGFEGLTGSLLAVAGTVGLVTAAYGKLQKIASSALDAQFARTTDISTIMQSFEISQKEATSLTDLARTQIAKYGRDLPVATSAITDAFSTIVDDYGAALKNKGLSNEAVTGIISSDAARFATLRGSLSTAGQGAFLGNVTSLLSGAVGAGEFKQLALYQSVPFRRNYENALKEAGIKDLKGLDAKSRVTLISNVLGQSITDEQIALQSSTGKAKLSSIQDSLFDPTSGIFSLSRNLSKKEGEYVTVIDEATKSLDLIFGSKGVFGIIGNLGFFGKGDPIEPIFQAVKGLNSYLDGVNANLAKLKSLSPAVAGGIIGKGAADLTNAVLDGIIGAVGSIDWGGVLVGVGSGIASFLANLDWKVYMAASIGLIGAALIPPLLAAVGGFALALGAGIVAVVGAPALLIGAAIVLGVVAVAKLIGGSWEGVKGAAVSTGSAIKRGYDSLATGVVGLIASGKNSLVGSLQFLFGKEGLKQVTGSLSSAWNMTKSGFGAIGNYVGAFIDGSIRGTQDFFSGLGDAFGQIFSAVGNAVNGVINAVKSIINGIVQPIQSAVNGLSGAVSGYVSNVQNTGGLLSPQNALPAISAAVNPIQAITGAAINKVASFFGARYAGQNLGLLDAINTENANKPSGSSLVVANSSELIVPRDQIPQTRRGNTTINVGGISLNIAGSTPLEIATQAINIIGDRLQSEIEAIIA